LKSHQKVKVRFECTFGYELAEDATDSIAFIYFYEGKENFYISLHHAISSIFITDEDEELRKAKPLEKHWTFNEQIMFIDDTIKDIHHRNNDTYGNIVYEGSLCNKTKPEILSLFREMIIVLAGTEKITVESSPIDSSLSLYMKNYIVKIENPSSSKKVVDFENIRFIINGG